MERTGTSKMKDVRRVSEKVASREKEEGRKRGVRVVMSRDCSGREKVY